MADQLVLDPAETAVNGLWHTGAPLPDIVRAFGRYPNTHEWKPGDLLLVSAVDGKSQAIVDAQLRGGFPENHARWHHAAGYLGAELLCEATVRGVRHVDVFTYVGQHVLRVLRDEALTDDERHEITVRMMARMRDGYSIGTIAKLFAKSFKGFWLREGVQKIASRGSCICSSLYADAYSAVTLKMLTGYTPHGVVIPAALSSSPRLTDVRLHWRQIAEM